MTLVMTLVLEMKLVCCRAQVAVTAALLHDVVDDTNVELSEIAAKFGSHVAEIIHFVSRLSDVNQLLRRQLRHEVQMSLLILWLGRLWHLYRVMMLMERHLPVLHGSQLLIAARI